MDTQQHIEISTAVIQTGLEHRIGQNPDETKKEPEPTDNPLDTKPRDMPLATCLDQMTVEQGVWAIRNADVWTAYLEDKGIDTSANKQRTSEVKVSNADKYQSICDTLERVWLDLTLNMERSHLEGHQISDWVETLQWAVKVMPLGYEKHRDIIQVDLKAHQELLTKPKKKRKGRKAK